MPPLELNNLCVNIYLTKFEINDQGRLLVGLINHFRCETVLQQHGGVVTTVAEYIEEQEQDSKIR